MFEKILTYVYELVGAPHPRASLIVVCLIGAVIGGVLSGLLWATAAKFYQEKASERDLRQRTNPQLRLVTETLTRKLREMDHKYRAKEEAVRAFYRSMIIENRPDERTNSSLSYGQKRSI